MDKLRTPNSTEQPGLTPGETPEPSKEPSVETSQKKADSELLAPPSEVTGPAEEQKPSEPSAAAQNEPTVTQEETAS